MWFVVVVVLLFWLCELIYCIYSCSEVLWQHVVVESMSPSFLFRALAKWDEFRSSVKINIPKAKFFWKEQYVNYIQTCGGVFTPHKVTDDMMRASFSTGGIVNVKIVCGLLFSLFFLFLQEHC